MRRATWIGPLLVGLGMLGLLSGCDKPACRQLRAAICVTGVDSPLVPVLCLAGRTMARQSANEHCAEVLTKLDLSVVQATATTATSPPPETPQK